MAPSKDPNAKPLKDRLPPGDPVSLTVEHDPKSQDRKPQDRDGAELPSASARDGAANSAGSGKTLKQMAEENPTRLGDPVSLKAEQSNTIPTPAEGGAKSTTDGAGSSRVKSKI